MDFIDYLQLIFADFENGFVILKLRPYDIYFIFERPQIVPLLEASDVNVLCWRT